jgi:hypothetical protein
MPVAATFRPEAFARLGTVPEAYRAKLDALWPRPTPEPVAASAVEVLRACKAGGCLELAEELLAANATLADVQATVAATTTAREAATARATEIRGLCTAAKQDDLADDYIAAGVSVAFVQAQLTKFTAKLDRVEIDAHLDPDRTAGATGERPALDVTAIYRERNGLAATTGGKA